MLTLFTTIYNFDSTIFALNSHPNSLAFDPLEQFEVLALHVPLCKYAVNSVAVILFITIVGCATLFNMQPVKGASNFDYAATMIYLLVKSIVRENLIMRRQRYFGTILYLFLMLFLLNLIGMIPFSFTVTSSFAFTLFVALGHFIAINLIGADLHQWRMARLFLPPNVPIVLIPLLSMIEIVSYSARVFSLSIRLFANMLSGHALLKILTGFCVTMAFSGSVMALVPWALVTAIMFLELLIAFLQAYVFAVLVTLYINDVVNLH